MFSHAIVRKPGKSLIQGLTTANLGPPDYSLALKQHQNYVEALKFCQLEVVELEADEQHPDSCFVEDVALLTPVCAFITRPGALSRQGEVEGIRPVIEMYYDDIVEIVDPGTIEAGDIMMVGKHFYIGLSERTNQAGAEQIIMELNKRGMNGSMIELNDLLHLKTGISYIENDTVVVTGELTTHPSFAAFRKLIVPHEEAYAANCIWVNGHVIIPHGFPETIVMVQDAGCQTIEVDVSEFRKLDGGLSCLSLRF